MFRGFRSIGGQSVRFPIDFAGHRYNSAAATAQPVIPQKMTKYSLVITPTPCRVAGGIISIRPTYSCACVLTYLLTYTE